MKNRSSLDVKKEILKYLKLNKEASLKTLEVKLQTGFRSIKIQCEELEFFGSIEIIKIKKNSKRLLRVKEKR